MSRKYRIATVVVGGIAIGMGGLLVGIKDPWLRHIPDGVPEAVSLPPPSRLPVELTNLDPLPEPLPDMAKYLPVVLEKFHPRFAVNPSDRAHILRLWGGRREHLTPGGRASLAAVVTFFLDDRLCRDPAAPDQVILQHTAEGVGYALWWRGEVAGSPPRVAGEKHPGQFLSALAEAEVSPSRTVWVGGQEYQIADLVEAAAQSFRLDGEIEWLAVALALYRPTPLEWPIRSGGTLSWDAITRELLRRADSIGQEELACAGTHPAYALAVLCRVDEQFPILSPDRRREVAAALRSAGDRLARTQLPDGSWDDNWQLPGMSGRGSRTAPVRRLLITGHHLEWLAVVPREFRPGEDVLRRAASFVISTLWDMPVDSVRQNFCPCTHGVRALLLQLKLAALERGRPTALPGRPTVLSGKLVVRHTRDDGRFPVSSE